ncbi:MAG TPA: hypothetical protein VGW75_10785 [Solirubrobacteraceae bacterium]|jgi:hypothetical protein|nr:hypothetical protein [Solirubrobacteraceae bacterium]
MFFNNRHRSDEGTIRRELILTRADTRSLMMTIHHELGHPTLDAIWRRSEKWPGTAVSEDLLDSLGETARLGESCVQHACRRLLREADDQAGYTRSTRFPAINAGPAGRLGGSIPSPSIFLVGRRTRREARTGPV